MAEILHDDIDFEFYLHETDAKTKIRPASIWVQELVDKLRNPDRSKKIFLPWEKTRSEFQLRHGEVTLWAGQNGHGKSLVTSQVALSLISQGEKVCIASFEMKPTTTLARMARMYAQTNPFSFEYQSEDGIHALEEIYSDFGAWTDGRMWLYDQQGTADASRVIGMARYCAKELGVTQIFIDSLMKCVHGEDDYNGQKTFVDELTSLAMDNGIHVHLIHHIRKPANESQIPDKYDNKGSGAITDLVDNVMMVWRNKPKEDDVKAKGQQSPKKAEHDAAILCRKQRNGEDEPTIRLWFDRDSQQYIGSPEDGTMYFPNFPHRPTP